MRKDGRILKLLTGWLLRLLICVLTRQLLFDGDVRKLVLKLELEFWWFDPAATADIVDVEDDTEEEEDDEDIVAAIYWLSGTGEGNTPAIYPTTFFLNNLLYN